jgi:hypothetical protein
MPSINDVFNELVQANARLLQLHNDLIDVKASTDAVKGSVDQVNASVNTGFTNVVQRLQAVIAQQTVTNQALVHLSQQSDTIICVLENISRNTCSLLNEAHTQTGLQASIQKSAAGLLELFKSVHPGAALELQRHEDLQKQILECCPPESPRPVCTYEPCEAPPPLRLPSVPTHGAD